MKRFAPLLLMLLCSCSSRTPLSEPTIAVAPATLIPDTGASLYLIEAPDDWLDDDGNIALTIESPKNTIWIGEQVLDLVLRHALSRKEVRFKAQGDFLITSGHPMELTLSDPESIETPPWVRFHVKLTALPGRSPGYVDLQWTARMLTTAKKGTETAATIVEGKVEAPLRATLVMHRHKSKDRAYNLLLRIASLEAPLIERER